MTEQPAHSPMSPPASRQRRGLPPALRRALLQLEVESLHPETPGSTLRTLGAVAGLSETHLQRHFQRQLGLSPARYAQLLHLRRAGLQLAYRPALSVLSIALDAGYANPESFARAFRRLTGQSPRRFRARPDWARWQAVCTPLLKIRSLHMSPLPALHEIEIRNVAAIPVIIFEHCGPASDLGASLRRFIDWRRAEGLSPARHATYNIFHTPPTIVPPEAFRLDLCLACPAARLTADRLAAHSELRHGEIAAGRVAVLRLIGDDSGLGPGFERLYRDWLPQSGEALRAHPPYAQRFRLYPDVPAAGALTELYLPLA
jgi:AraC family transcriptional regulator